MDTLWKKYKNLNYMGLNINEKNNMHDEVGLILSAANKSYYAMKEKFLSKLLSSGTKQRLYITYLRPTVTYACETWASARDNKGKLAKLRKKNIEKNLQTCG